MKRLLLIALILVAFVSRASAQTATATSTATATATAPAAASTTSQFNSKTTNLGYLAATPANADVFGGYKINQVATSALLIGQIVKPDTTAGAVVVSTSGTTDPIGVVIGAGKCTTSSCGTTCAQPLGGYGVPPCAGQTAVVQISGISYVACDRVLATGTVVMSSAIVNGMVGPYVAGTVDEQIGVLLTACTTAGPAQILLYK